MSDVLVGEPILAAALGADRVKLTMAEYESAYKQWALHDDNSVANNFGIHFYLTPMGKGEMMTICAPKEWPQAVVLRFYQMGELPDAPATTFGSGTNIDQSRHMDSATEEQLRRYLNPQTR